MSCGCKEPSEFQFDVGDFHAGIFCNRTPTPKPTHNPSESFDQLGLTFSEAVEHLGVSDIAPRVFCTNKADNQCPLVRFNVDQNSHRAATGTTINLDTMAGSETPSEAKVHNVEFESANPCMLSHHQLSMMAQQFSDFGFHAKFLFDGVNLIKICPGRMRVELANTPGLFSVLKAELKKMPNERHCEEHRHRKT